MCTYYGISVGTLMGTALGWVTKLSGSAEIFLFVVRSTKKYLIILYVSMVITPVWSLISTYIPT